MHPIIQQHDLENARLRDGGQLHIGPGLNLSSLLKLDRAIPVRGFAIKYVLEGTEEYTVNGVRHRVGGGQYLLANQCCETRVLIDAERPVNGLCIELTTALLDEVVQAEQHPEAFGDRGGKSYFSGPDFLEGVYTARHTSLGPVLERLAANLFADPADARYAGSGLYHGLAERVVQDHRGVVRGLQAVGAVRSGTRKDIYRRVQRARAFMEADLGTPVSVEDMARVAAMSTAHFIRAFHNVVGSSPHHYRMQRRLSRAHEVLTGGHSSVQDAAMLAGFADAPSFTKAFRKYHGYAPSQLLRGSRRK